MPKWSPSHSLTTLTPSPSKAHFLPQGLWQQRLPDNKARPTPRRLCSWSARAIPKGRAKTGPTSSNPMSRSRHAESQNLRRRALELPRRLRLRAQRQPGGTDAKAQAFRAGAFSKTFTFSTPARAARRQHSFSTASATCSSAGKMKPLLAAKELGKGQFEIVAPPASASSPNCPWPSWTKSPAAMAPEALAKAYLEYLYTPEGQEIAARAISTAPASKPWPKKYHRSISRKRNCSPLTDSVRRLAPRPKKPTSAEGGTFDQIYTNPKANNFQTRVPNTQHATRNTQPSY